VILCAEQTATAAARVDVLAAAPADTGAGEGSGLRRKEQKDFRTTGKSLRKNSKL